MRLYLGKRLTLAWERFYGVSIGRFYIGVQVLTTQAEWIASLNLSPKEEQARALRLRRRAS